MYYYSTNSFGTLGDSQKPDTKAAKMNSFLLPWRAEHDATSVWAACQTIVSGRKPGQGTSKKYKPIQTFV